MSVCCNKRKFFQTTSTSLKQLSGFSLLCFTVDLMAHNYGNFTYQTTTPKPAKCLVFIPGTQFGIFTQATSEITILRRKRGVKLLRSSPPCQSCTFSSSPLLVLSLLFMYLCENSPPPPCRKIFRGTNLIGKKNNRMERIKISSPDSPEKNLKKEFTEINIM